MVPPSADWLIVGFGVGEDEVAGLLERNAPPAQKPGFAPTGSGGVFEVLAKRQPPERGFVELGFDALEISHGMLWHTCLDFDLSGTKAYAARSAVHVGTRPPTSRLLRRARWRAAHERACSAVGPGAERAAQFRRSHPELPLTGYEGDGIHAGNQEELRWQSAAQLTPC